MAGTLYQASGNRDGVILKTDLESKEEKMSGPHDGLCAVEGCKEKGMPHVCPYDKRYHHHGCIHYNCGYPVHSVSFKHDGWRWVCDKHYALLKREREEWETDKPAKAAK